MRRILRENGLSLAMFTLFLLTLLGLIVSGHAAENEERADHGERPQSFVEYLGSGSFVEAVFENWESEFLQMGTYVVLTAFLYQKGSPESKKLGEAEAVDEDPREATKRNAPWPVRQGGLVLTLYENSLSLALFGLFFLSFALHAIGGASQYSEEQLQHGGEAVSPLQYLGTAQFWYESMQNWQSEFLAIAIMVGASVYLRQRGSPESKPVAQPHSETGS
jgi:Domain of unknown function (DUF6766)